MNSNTQLSAGEQIDMFQKHTEELEAAEEIAQKNRWNEFTTAHPFMFHILRVDVEGLVHINTIYKDYNDSHYPKEPYENRLTKYSYCESIEDLVKVQSVERPKVHYVMANVDYAQLKSLKNYLD